MTVRNLDVVSGLTMCPRCLDQNAYLEVNNTLGEETVICSECGYIRVIKAEVENGEVVSLLTVDRDVPTGSKIH